MTSPTPEVRGRPGEVVYLYLRPLVITTRDMNTPRLRDQNSLLETQVGGLSDQVPPAWQTRSEVPLRVKLGRHTMEYFSPRA